MLIFADVSHSRTTFEEAPSIPDIPASLQKDEALALEPETCSEQSVEAIALSGASLVGQMLASSSVTETSLLQTLRGVGEITESMVAYFKATTAEFVASQAPQLNMKPLLEKFSQISNPVECYSSERKIRNYFREQPEFVPPISIIFGIPRFETKRGFDGKPIVNQINDTWQYVPISQTLKVKNSKNLRLPAKLAI